jgi:hypothetical protein
MIGAAPEISRGGRGKVRNGSMTSLLAAGILTIRQACFVHIIRNKSPPGRVNWMLSDTTRTFA